MRLDTIQSLVIILMVALATQITRWTPFLLFSGERNTLLSILAGTACYMALVQLVF